MIWYSSAPRRTIGSARHQVTPAKAGTASMSVASNPKLAERMRRRIVLPFPTLTMGRPRRTRGAFGGAAVVAGEGAKDARIPVIRERSRHGESAVDLSLCDPGFPQVCRFVTEPRGRSHWNDHDYRTRSARC